MKQTSVITRINLAMGAIILMAISTMMVSYWLSDQADNDAYVVNIAGSMRMHSYRMMLNDSEQQQQHRQDIQAIFSNPIVQNVVHNAKLTHEYQTLESKWHALVDNLNQPNTARSLQVRLLDDFVSELNNLVLGIQHNAESNIRTLRTFQVIAFFITFILSAVVIYWIHLRFTLPLNELTHTARQISRGDFSYNISPTSSDDELGVLSRSFERMCKAIAYMYESLEKQVEDKTTELRNSNKSLSLLYTIARRISAHEVSKNDFDSIIQELSATTGVEKIKLCLLTETGDIPYLQINGNKQRDCSSRSCRDCIAGEYSNEADWHFAVSRENRDYGVLTVKGLDAPLPYWQQELFKSVSSLFAIAMSLQNDEENIRRMTLINERTVIARELHDSLAQALSYLKIQVTRLNRAIGTNNYEVMMDVSGELKHGLDSAYRQLRELLTTFRLKIDGKGLSDALAKTIEQYREQTSMQITLDYQIINIPLTPQEEIHLIQIIREACQNAINHSHGTQVVISLKPSEQGIELAIEDDGIGIGSNPEKLNHYGMAIIQERGHQLKGQINILRRQEGGTGVYFDFQPEYLRKKIAAVDVTEQSND